MGIQVSAKCSVACFIVIVHCTTLKVFQPWILFYLDGALPYWVSLVRDFQGEIFPDRWMRRNMGQHPNLHAVQILHLLIFFLLGLHPGKLLAAPTADVKELRV